MSRFDTPPDLLSSLPTTVAAAILLALPGLFLVELHPAFIAAVVADEFREGRLHVEQMDVEFAVLAAFADDVAYRALRTGGTIRWDKDFQHGASP